MKHERIQSLNKRILEDYTNENIVFGDGNLDCSIMLIGEAPGAKEVELKKPFVGQAGKYLDEFIEVLDIEREQLYITNVVKYRPTKKSTKTDGVVNRTPTNIEIEKFKKYLIEEIDIIDPEIIVPLGNTPIKGIFEDNLKIGEVHGKALKANIKGKEYMVFPLYHPAAVIYRRELKKVYLDDLQELKKLIKKC